MTHLTLTRLPHCEVEQKRSSWVAGILDVCTQMFKATPLFFCCCVTHRRTICRSRKNVMASREGSCRKLTLLFGSDGDKRLIFVLAGCEEERGKGGAVCQLAFSQCTHALILLFSTVLRTAEVRITLSPPFNATDTTHA